MTLVEQLAAFARDVLVPNEVRASVRQRVLDVAGVALAAVRLDTSRAAIEHARELGGAQQARAIGCEVALPAPSAAFVNGVLAHSLDYDDTHLPSILHPSASVVPAALAAADLVHANGAQLIDAIAIGLEICVRLGMAGYDSTTRQSLFFERGQHATSICGAIAGAAAAAKLIAPKTIEHAMGLAVSMGAGVIEGNRAGGTVKRIHCGIAAQSGVTAAMLARRGFTGPPTALEGRFGFFQAFLDGEFEPDAITDELGTRWEVPRIFFKPYPANHFTHALIDAAIELKTKGVAPGDIKSIEAGVAAPTVRTIGEPIDAKRNPPTGYQAQFSGPYAIAAALHGGSGLGLGLDDFTDELAHDPERVALMQKVTVTADEECDAVYPMQFPAILRARTNDGTEHVVRVMTNRGGDQRPLSDAELATKFRDNANRSLPPDVVVAVSDAAARLDSLASIDELLDPMTNAK